jgi:glycosyltransferase involved in cell wall biosynthesis
MSARRILLLCYFYPPLAGGGVYRVLGFTRHLPRFGWQPTVICAGEEDYWVTDETLSSSTPAGVEVIRVPGARFTRGLAARGRRSGSVFAGLKALSDWWTIPDAYVGWARRAARVASRRISERGGFDAVLSSSPPDSVHLAALPLKPRHRLPWIADFRDPWMGLDFRTPPTAWHRRRQRAHLQSVLDGADLLLAASATHAERLEADTVTPGRVSRVIHLPNGFEPFVAPLATASTPESDPAPRFRCVYTGILTHMPDVLVFFEALHALLRDLPEARRRLRVSLLGPYDSDYADRAIGLGLSGIVEFLGPRPHAEARALQRDADLLLLWKPRGFPTMVPGKLYEYLDAARPLLAVLDPTDEAARLVARAAGTVVPPAATAALAAEIGRHYRAWRAGAPVRASRPAWLDEHSRERLTGRLAAALDRLIAVES